jgi:hypothetical protein
LGAGIGAIFIALAAAIRGAKKGKPTGAAVVEMTKSITKVSCGAPEVSTMVREVLAQMNEHKLRQVEMKSDIERMAEKVTRIEDRTSHR